VASTTHERFAFKQSQATKIWLCMVGIVLAVLYLEMHGHAIETINYCVSTDIAGIGASVFVDHFHLGEIVKDDNSGLGGGAFRGRITNGKHLIEIKKPGYRDFCQEIDMEREQFMQVNLQKGSG